MPTLDIFSKYSAHFCHSFYIINSLLYYFMYLGFIIHSLDFRKVLFNDLLEFLNFLLNDLVRFDY